MLGDLLSDTYGLFSRFNGSLTCYTPFHQDDQGIRELLTKPLRQWQSLDFIGNAVYQSPCRFDLFCHLLQAKLKSTSKSLDFTPQRA